MADAVYLHIGVPKSGSTYVQEILWGNQQRLHELGYRLPAGAHQDIVRAALDLCQRRTGPRISGAWTRLADQVRVASSRVVISQEQLCRASVEQVAIAVASLGPTHTTVVITARDPARQLTSYWQQQVKGRYTGSFAEMIQVIISRQTTHDDFWGHQDVLEIVDRWLTVVPASNLTVVTLPPAGNPQDELWRRFASACGIDPAGFGLDVERPNESLGLAQVELLRRVNLALGDRLPVGGGYALVRRLVADEFLATQHDHLPLALDESTHRWAVVLANDWRRGLRERGVRVAGDLDDLLPAPWHAVPPEQIAGEESISRSAVTVIADLLARWEDLAGVPGRPGLGGARRRGS